MGRRFVCGGIVDMRRMCPYDEKHALLDMAIFSLSLRLQEWLVAPLDVGSRDWHNSRSRRTTDYRSGRLVLLSRTSLAKQTVIEFHKIISKNL
jgi:hypothetical protein